MAKLEQLIDVNVAVQWVSRSGRTLLASGYWGGFYRVGWLYLI